MNKKLKYMFVFFVLEFICISVMAIITTKDNHQTNKCTEEIFQKIHLHLEKAEAALNQCFKNNLEEENY